MQQTINIGLLGLGTVGQGVVNLIKKNREEIKRRIGHDIVIKQAAVKNLNKKRDIDLSQIELVDDPLVVVNNPEIDIVIELIGGNDFVKQTVLTALQLGKPVVTANKAMIAEHGEEIFATARKHQTLVTFEAAVAGGIPIIKVLREGLSANKIDRIAGIINGTANFILSSMSKEKREFNEVLKEAQEKGYAEADPSFDIDGIDVAHKLAIIAACAFGTPLQYHEIHREGISFITPRDVLYAEQLGYCIKQLGIAIRSNQGLQLRVHPTMIPSSSVLAHVNGVMNAILIHGDAVGSTVYYGAGAGSRPTASSVIADILDVIRVRDVKAAHRVPHMAYLHENRQHLPMQSMDDLICAYYIRLHVNDEAGVLADVTKILGEENISIEALLQKEYQDKDQTVPIIVITHLVREQHIRQAVMRLEKLESVKAKVIYIRIDQLT